MSAGTQSGAGVPPRGTSLCVHNRRKNECRACKGSSICEHNKRRNECKDCNGASICEHRRRRRECKECGGSSICEHKMLKRRCKQCKGASICEHNRRKNECKDCAGTSICLHNRLRRHCKQCGGTSICEHKRRRNVCKDCKGTSIPEGVKLSSEAEGSHDSGSVQMPNSFMLPSSALETLGLANAGNASSFLIGGMQGTALQGALSGAAKAPNLVPQQTPAMSAKSDEKAKLAPSASTAAMIALLRAQLQNLPRPSLPQPALPFNLNTTLNALPLPQQAPTLPSQQAPPLPQQPPLSRSSSLALLGANLQSLSGIAPPPSSFGLSAAFLNAPVSLNDSAMPPTSVPAQPPLSGPPSGGFQLKLNAPPAVGVDGLLSDIRTGVLSDRAPTSSAIQLPQSFFNLQGNQM